MISPLSNLKTSCLFSDEFSGADYKFDIIFSLLRHFDALFSLLRHFDYKFDIIFSLLRHFDALPCVVLRFFRYLKITYHGKTKLTSNDAEYMNGF